MLCYHICMNELTLQKQRYQALLPALPERARRLVVASDAQARGYGGVSFVWHASGMARSTIASGINELKAGMTLEPDRNRRPGGGRHKLTADDPTMVKDLLAIVEESAQGDPMSILQWTNKGLITLSKALKEKNHTVSHTKVGQLLVENKYRLQANKKTKEGTNHPDRDAQFRYINAKANTFITAVNPIISIDTKKKELVGNYKNNGQTWLPTGKPIEVNGHDFPDKKMGKASPYGIYDLSRNEGYVNVGIDHDTAEFAVASIRRWWESLGQPRYPKATALMITADSGGSNSRRSRLWKKELQTFADETKLTVIVCHYPPGTSKWNKIEHRLFSHISINWKGKPLTSYEVIINLIANTTTATGLVVYAVLDDRKYELRKKVTKEEMKTIRLIPDAFHGEWNYTIKPRGS